MTASNDPIALAGVRKAIAIPTKEIAPRPVPLGTAPPAGNSVHHADADEMGLRATETIRYADDVDGLGHALPFAIADAHAIAEVQPVGLGAQVDQGGLLAIAGPLPTTCPARTEASRLV